MDGHMSKASRDLSRGVGVKSNGLKYGGGNKEGWGTGGQKGRRCGAGGGRRDVAARARLKEVLERKRAAAEAGEDAGSGAGAKRKRSGGAGGDGIAKKAHKRDDRPKPKPAVPEPAEATTKDEDVAKHAEADDAVDDPTRWTCATCGGVKCGNKANYTAHVLSNKHKKAAQRERGRATLAALKAKAATAS